MPGVREFDDEQVHYFLSHHPDAVVADVATDPNSGLVLEEATGFAKTIIVAIPRDNEVVLSRGVVYSQYEFAVPLSQRMTDESWHEILNSQNYYTRENLWPEIAPWKWSYTVRE